MDGALLAETGEHLKLLRERYPKQKNWRVTQFEAVVELHRKWANVHRGITWGEALRKEAESRERG
jgi:hypothetical protein